METNYCDHGHATAGEVRKLPLGHNANILVCHAHYVHELKFRREMEWQKRDGFDPFPKWEDLKVYDPA